jgi:pilus assembly protein CpaC
VGNTLILAGETRNPQVAERAVALAATMDADAQILDHIIVPDRGQILLQVRIAEVGRTAMRDLGSHLIRVDPFNVRGDDEGLLSPGGVTPAGGSFLGSPPGPEQTFSDAVNFFFFHNSSSIAAFIQALQAQGNFRSLAEPNLMTLPGETASVLAGGEFPYPVVQGGASSGGVTVEFREFGVRLNFTPQITNSGAIRLAVEPEVSTLDFSGGLELGGFQIPVLLSRRASTVVEVQEGQTFAIAGLMNHEMTESIRKIPLLGDIPILGALFRSSGYTQSQTELLVLVTPYLVGPGMATPEIPTGEVETWNWFGSMQPDTADFPVESQQGE